MIHKETMDCLVFARIFTQLTPVKSSLLLDSIDMAWALSTNFLTSGSCLFHALRGNRFTLLNINHFYALQISCSNLLLNKFNILLIQYHVHLQYCVSIWLWLQHELPNLSWCEPKLQPIGITYKSNCWTPPLLCSWCLTFQSARNRTGPPAALC